MKKSPTLGTKKSETQSASAATMLAARRPSQTARGTRGVIWVMLGNSGRISAPSSNAV